MAGAYGGSVSIKHHGGMARQRSVAWQHLNGINSAAMAASSKRQRRRQRFGSWRWRNISAVS